MTPSASQRHPQNYIRPAWKKSVLRPFPSRVAFSPRQAPLTSGSIRRCAETNPYPQAGVYRPACPTFGERNLEERRAMKEQMKNKTQLTRREFLGTTAALAAFSIVPRHVLARSGQPAPGEKMNIGCVGVGGMQGGNDVQSVSSQNIYALCDVDESQLNKTAAQYPNAKRYRDFREMLDKEQKNLHGITITIPDHMHASVALRAMERGIAVYCQKPLTQTVWEARLLTKAAQKYKVTTQMGNQGYSSVATRIACEIIWHGDLGEITEVHSMSAGGFSPGITKGAPRAEGPPTIASDSFV